MRQLIAFVARLRGLFRPQTLETDFANELESHIEMHTDAVARSESALGGKRFAELFARGAQHPREAMISFALTTWWR